ncbi:hypothetical protein AVEN_110119-1 [Araneus ventricosus]|uniref:Uncharacterized protein n=1 Tax=Araneus ventricosus TaxID=182803 RepID=A0A4Y2J1H4_ARAVE|nr:hypothetical protein AVEN_110119-1 [Araneus ventricosus]
MQHLLQSTSEELSTATEILLRKQGKIDSAAIIKELSAASPNRDNGLSTRQYHRIREQAENLNNKFYPPYHKVKDSKQLYYPHGTSVTETSAEMTVQTLVDHTVSRICHIEFVIEKIRLSTNATFEVIMKWGCDGYEQNRCKQKFLRKFSVTKAFSAFV